jgi:hypothetical protein
VVPAQALLDGWLDARCGAKDQIALWYAVYALARERGCLTYDPAALVNMTYADARVGPRRGGPRARGERPAAAAGTTRSGRA